MAVTDFSFDVGTRGRVSAAVHRASDPLLEATLILAHGAGAPRTHPFMTAIASRLALGGIDVVTFNFLYAEAGRRMPDRVESLEACWRAAIATVRARGGLPTERLFIGGKSMGGRMATHIAAADEGLILSGVVLLGYPLHPLGKPKVVREEILGVEQPMLVVQGTRDELGTASELKKLLRDLPRAKVVPIEGADHAFAVPRPQARGDRALDTVAAAVLGFVGPPGRDALPPERANERKRTKRTGLTLGLRALEKTTRPAVSRAERKEDRRR